MAELALVLTGPDGAGKTTLLRCLVGADSADEGSVELDGTRVSETDPRIRRDLAVVIDDLDFFPDLSVVEHLDLLARAHAQAPDRAEEVRERMRIGITKVRASAVGSRPEAAVRDALDEVVGDVAVDADPFQAALAGGSVDAYDTSVAVRVVREYLDAIEQQGQLRQDNAPKVIRKLIERGIIRQES